MASHTEEVSCPSCKVFRATVSGLRGESGSRKQRATVKHGIAGKPHEIIIVKNDAGTATGGK